MEIMKSKGAYFMYGIPLTKREMKLVLWDYDYSGYKLEKYFLIFEIPFDLLIIYWGVDIMIHGSLKWGFAYLYFLGGLNFFQTHRTYKKYRKHKSQMRVLIIDPPAKERIAAVVKHAQENVFEIADLLKPEKAPFVPVGDDPRFCCHINNGFRVVYSVEKHPTGKVFRHISVSIDAQGKLPNIAAIKEIMKDFGFKNKIINCILHIQDIGNFCQAVNVLEQIK